MKYWIPTFLLTAMVLSFPLIARDGEHEHRERHERGSNPKKHGNGEHHREHSERERRHDGEHDKVKLHHLEAKANHLRKEIELSEKHGKVEHAEKLRGHLREVHHIIERVKNGHNTHENGHEEHRDHHQVEIREKAKGLQKKADYLKRQIATLNALAKKRRLIKCATISKKFTSTFSTFKNTVEIITANMVKGENGKNTKDAFTIFVLPSKTYILQGCRILQRA